MLVAQGWGGGKWEGSTCSSHTVSVWEDEEFWRWMDGGDVFNIMNTLNVTELYS